ncbi:N-acetyltransferase family protein [Laceyella tengchongensis]
MSFIHLSLDLTTIDATAISPKPLEPPYHLFTLAQAGDNEMTRRALYPLVREGVLDDPGCRSGEFESYEDFVTRIYPTSYWPHRETTLLISHGQKWIALSTLAIDGTCAHTGLTVVSKAYRGTGMATILKQHLLHICLAKGVQRVETRVAHINKPMLAINTKLGFVAIQDHSDSS